MKILYLDCTAGICADMFVSGLISLGADDNFADPDEINEIVKRFIKEESGHLHGTSYKTVRKIIDSMPVENKVKEIAGNIYHTIAVAEAEVHEATLETVHFHEVGRSEAVINIIRTSYMIAQIEPDRIICSEIHDGKGTIECSHGIIPVPVPAVKAMMKRSDLVFRTDDIDMEMVTPSGLGILTGIGAEYDARPAGSLIAKGTGYGDRDTGRRGMEIYLIEA